MSGAVAAATRAPIATRCVTSLIALKAMTSETTGAVIAAPTTSLPEDIGGERNWDYRYCWLRDSVLTLEALLAAGYTEEALAFRDFLLRVGTGDPAKIQIMYGVGGRAPADRVRARRSCPGTRARGRSGSATRRPSSSSSTCTARSPASCSSAPSAWARSRRGSGPAGARSSSTSRRSGAGPTTGSGRRAGPQRHYTYSKVMAWVVFDRAVRLAERFALEAPVERWTQVRDEIHREVCERGYDPERRTFTQYYGSRELDASVLNIPLVGFLPGTDERVTGTIDAVARELGRDGFVSRYSTAETDDGLAGRRGPVPGLLVLARQRARAQRPRRRGARAVRAAARPGQRRRPARRGVRRRAPAAGRQLPAGVQPPHADPRRARHLRGRSRPGGGRARAVTSGQGRGLGVRRRLDVRQAQHAERVEQPDQAREDRDEQRDLQRAVVGVGVDADDLVLDRLGLARRRSPRSACCSPPRASSSSASAICCCWAGGITLAVLGHVREAEGEASRAGCRRPSPARRTGRTTRRRSSRPRPR